MVCAASKALVERAEQQTFRRGAEALNMPKHLQFCSKLQVSKVAWLPRGPDPNTPFGGTNLPPKPKNSAILWVFTES